MTPGAIVTAPPAHLTMLSSDYERMRHDHALGVNTNAALNGLRSATPVEKPLGSCRYVSTPSGANKLFEFVENNVVDINPSRPGWKKPFIFRQYQNRMNGGSAAGECFQGIQIGSFGTAPPWQTNYVASPIGQPVVQLRWNETLTRWEVCVWDAYSGVAPDVVACSSQPAFEVDTVCGELALVYLPNDGAPTLQAYFNGALIHTYSGARLTELYNYGSMQYGAGYFMTNGSNNTSWAEAGFYGGAIYHPMRLP